MAYRSNSLRDIHLSRTMLPKERTKSDMEMARNMLEAKHFPNEYWGEAVATVVYIMNWCPTKSVKNKVPQEVWTGMNHSVSHLKVFGCVTYAHVLDELRKKLDKKGHKCIFFVTLKTQKHTSSMTLSQGK